MLGSLSSSIMAREGEGRCVPMISMPLLSEEREGAT
jgi:hypothetical protein